MGTEKEDFDSFSETTSSLKESESLINEDEEEDLEIPAFLRKQKN